jgi:WD40-like Beta Propeller Repeat
MQLRVPPAVAALLAMPIAAAVAVAAAQTAPSSPPAVVQQPATEIYLAPMKFGPAGPLVGPARNVTENPGRYDNQPFFGSDGRTMLFTSNRDGKQTDIYFLELPTRQMRQFTRTAESEFSPTVMPDDAGVSAIRVEADGTQRLWKFGELGGGPTLLLPGIKPAGYHAWIDAGRVAVYVLGTPATLQIVEVASGKADTVARDIGRALLRRPTGTITFVHRENGVATVKEYDPADRAVRPLVAALGGNPEQDAAWGPDGSLFMTRDGEVHAWRPGWDGFRLVGDPGIGQLSRLAVSGDGRWMALVAAERQN